MDSKELQIRTKKFALDIIKLVANLPNNRVGWTFTDQIVRSSTSVAANYRAVCRAKSDRDFISKMGTVLEEADEIEHEQNFTRSDDYNHARFHMTAEKTIINI